MATEDWWFESAVPEGESSPPEIDVSAAHPARMYNYYLSGKTHFAADREAADKVLAVLDQLKEAMPAGSYLAISHGTQDFSPQRAAAAVRGYDHASAPFVLRSREQVAGLLSGLDLVEPGLVQLPFWRPDGSDGGDPSKIWLYAGVGRKS